MNGPFRAYIWLGAGIFALGMGAALAGGSGTAHADAGTGSSGVAHHQKRISAPATSSRITKPKSRAVVAGVRANVTGSTVLSDQDKAIAEEQKAIAAQHKEFRHDVQTAVHNFSTLPPEVNSSRLYSGAGSAALLDAASAWNNLADNLNGAAQGFDRAAKVFDGATWAGPASVVMSNAANGYAGWLSAQAGQAENAATQASASAAAFETAFVAGVPPAVVAANRAQLAQLVAVNVFTGNLPAIVATEAMYAGMWAQDVAGIIGYHPTPKP